jgi:hypothetical protein
MGIGGQTVLLENTVLREILGAKVGGSDERLEKIASRGAS